MRFQSTGVTGWKRVRMPPSPKEGVFRFSLCAHNEDYDNSHHFQTYFTLVT